MRGVQCEHWVHATTRPAWKCFHPESSTSAYAVLKLKCSALLSSALLCSVCIEFLIMPPCLMPCLAVPTLCPDLCCCAANRGGLHSNHQRARGDAAVWLHTKAALVSTHS